MGSNSQVLEYVPSAFHPPVHAQKYIGVRTLSGDTTDTNRTWQNIMQRGGTGTCLRCELTASHSTTQPSREKKTLLTFPFLFSFPTSPTTSPTSALGHKYSTSACILVHNVYFLNHNTLSAFAVALVSIVMCSMYCACTGCIADVGILEAYRKHPAGTSAVPPHICPNAVGLMPPRRG